jgi:hypothetical protein
VQCRQEIDLLIFCLWRRLHGIVRWDLKRITYANYSVDEALVTDYIDAIGVGPEGMR